MTTTSLKTKMISGAIWMVGMRWSIRLIGLISTVILARMLVPADFGIVAMSMILILFVEVITEMRIEMIIIREKNIDDDFLNTAWTINIIRGIIVTLILITTAPLVSGYFSEPKLTNVIYLLAAGTFIFSFANTGMALVQKNLEFGKEFKYNVVTKIGTFCITMFFVFYLESYWALIIGITSGMVIKTALSYCMHEFRPTLSLNGWKKIVSFSYIMTINSIIGFFNMKTSEILIGGNYSTSTLGDYTMSKNIAPIPTSELVEPLSKSLFPGYSKLVDDPTRLKNAFLKTIASMMILILPISVGFYVTMPDIIPLLLGEKWLQIIPLCQIMVITYCMVAITSNFYTIPVVIGREKWLPVIGLINFSMIIPAVYLTVNSGGTLTDIATATTTVSVVYTFIVVSIVFRLLRISMIEFWYLTRRPFIASYVVYYCVSQAENWMLITKVILGMVVYCIAITILCILTDKKSSIEYDLLNILLKKFRT